MDSNPTSISPNGSGQAPFDQERFNEIRRIVAEMATTQADAPLGKITRLFQNEGGYATPKIDVRGGNLLANPPQSFEGGVTDRSFLFSLVVLFGTGHTS